MTSKRHVVRQSILPLASLLTSATLLGLATASALAASVTITHFEVTELSKLEALMKITALFEAEYPDYRVEVLHAPYPDFADKLTTMIAAGTEPDVIPLQTYISHGIALDFRPYIERDNWQPDDILSSFIERRPWWRGPSGEIFAIPFGFAIPITMYNKDLLAQAGVPVPTVDWDDAGWTWSDWVESLRRTTRDINGDGVVDQYGTDEFNPWDLAFPIFDARFFSEDLARFEGNSAQGIRALEALHELIHRFDVWAVGNKGFPGSFWAGSVAMRVSGSHELFHARNRDLGFTFDIAPTPRAERRATYFWVDPLVVSARSPHPDAVWEWVKFLMRPEIMQIYVVEGHGKIPASQDLIPWFSDGAGGIFPSDLSARLLLEGVTYDAIDVAPWNGGPAPFGEIYSMLTNDVWFPVVNGTEAPAQLLEKIAPVIQAKLDEGN